MARMRRQQMSRIAALREHADVLRREAKVLITPLAHLALAAAHPWIDQAHVADLDAFGFWAKRNNFAHVLVPHGERQLDPAVRQHQFLTASNLVVAVPDVQVGVAHAGGKHLQKHLRALRLWSLALVHMQRRAAFAHLKTPHSHFGLLPTSPSEPSLGGEDHRRHHAIGIKMWMAPTSPAPRPLTTSTWSNQWRVSLAR